MTFFQIPKRFLDPFDFIALAHWQRPHTKIYSWIVVWPNLSRSRCFFVYLLVFLRCRYRFGFVSSVFGLFSIDWRNCWNSICLPPLHKCDMLVDFIAEHIDVGMDDKLSNQQKHPTNSIPDTFVQFSVDLCKMNERSIFHDVGDWGIQIHWNGR